jgi:hypothetical protein
MRCNGGTGDFVFLEGDDDDDDDNGDESQRTTWWKREPIQHIIDDVKHHDQHSRDVFGIIDREW